MEKNSSVKKFLKKRKKKKPNSSSVHEQTTVKPETFNGMTNWLKLQQQLKEEGQCQKNTLNSSNQHSKLYKGKYKSKKYKGKNQILSLQKPNTKPCRQFSFKFTDSKVMESETGENISEEKDIKKLTKTLAIDCEMVGTGLDGIDSMLARVSIVNSLGDCVYDTFVKPKEKVTDYRTQFSGVRPADLKKGKDLFDVQKDVLSIIEGRRIVGHDLKHDFDVLLISHPKSLLRDTAKYKPFRSVSGGRTPSLQKLAASILNYDIQKGEHNSIEDAQAAMLLYLQHKKEWEGSLKSTKRKKR